MRKKNLWKKAASVIIAAAMMMSVMPVYAATQEQPAEVVVQGTTDEETDDVVETELYVDDEENVGPLQTKNVKVSTAQELRDIIADTNTTYTTDSANPKAKYKNLTIDINADIDLREIEESWRSGYVNGYDGAELYIINGNNHIIKNLPGALFDRTWAGNGQLIINDLKIKNSTIRGGSTNTDGLGAFVGYAEATSRIELNNCHVIGCTIAADKKWTGGLIGYAAGYNRQDDGPVSEYITIKDCSVENSTITGAGSTGAFLGHATGNAWTYVTIQDCKAEGNTITCTDEDSNKAGSVMGTVGVGKVTVNNVTVSGNTVSSNNVKNKRIAGRFGSAGKLTISGGSYDCKKSEAMPLTYEGSTLTIDKENKPQFSAVAVIGDVRYDSLQEAVNATDNATIQLLSDTTENITILEGKNITLDLNGKTLTNTSDHTITNKGTLTIIDSVGTGIIDNVTHGKGAIYNTGTLTIKGGNITRSAEASQSPTSNGGNSWYVIYNKGIIDEISGGKIYSNGFYSSLICNCGTSVNNIAKINKISGGEFSHNFVILKNDDYSEIGEISGGTFTVGEGATQTAVLLNYGNIGKISGGTFTNNGSWVVISCSNWMYNNQNSTDIVGKIDEISGGSFKAAENGTVILLNTGAQNGVTYTQFPAINKISGGQFDGAITVTEGGTLGISGGTFSSDPSAYVNVAEGYHAHSNTAENKWGVSTTAGHNYNYKVEGYNYYCICGDSVYIPPYTPPQPTTPPATTDTVTNPDGSTTSTTTQENTDGSTTTTVVDKDSNGNVTGTTETTEKITGNTTTKTETATTVDGAQTVTETTTVKNQDGSTEETKKVTDKDANGNVTGTTETVEKTEGNTTTTKETTTAADGSQTVTESTLVKNEDGSSEEKATITAADGSVTNVTTTTQTDGSATEVKETSEKNDAGNTVDVTATTKTDSNGDVTSVKEQSVITNVADNTSATVNVLKDGEDNVKYSRATVNKTVDEDTTRVKLEGPVVDQIESASGTSNVTITMNVNTDDGDTKYSLKVATKNLQAGNKLYVYKENPETGERTMVNSLLYTVAEDGSVTFNTKQNANFVLVNKASAAALNKAIKKTLTAAKPSSSVKAGKKIKMALNPNLNMENVKSVKYSTTQSSVAKVSSNGTITAKKAGTVSIKATITLKNGYIKTVTTKITVKE